MASSEGDDAYQPVDAIKEGVKAAGISAAAGFFFSAVRSATTAKNIGVWGVFTHGGGAILTFTFAGGAFMFAKCATANLREKDDHWNAAVGGALGGAVLGLRYGRFTPIVGFGAGIGTLLAVTEYTGGSLRGSQGQFREGDEFDRKERLRKNRRVPIEETLASIGGEGRGIRPPGYEERRRQRLKEKYGFEVKTVSAEAE